MPDITRTVRAGVAAGAIAVSLVALTACAGSKKAAASAAGPSIVSSSTASSSATSSSATSSSTVPDSTVPTTTVPTTTVPTTTVPTTTASSAAAGGSGGGAKCTDLSDAAASAALGKKVTITATPVTKLAGLTICDVTVAGEIYPIQLDVNSADGPALFAGDLKVSSVASIRGLGDQAFHSSIGVEALSGGVDIQVIGPAGPVLSNDFSVPTALVKAMIAAIR